MISDQTTPNYEVTTQRGKPYEEMNQAQITKLLTRLKIKGLIRSKDQVRKLESAVQERRLYCANLEQLTLIAQNQIDMAVANSAITASEAEAWKQHLETLTDEQTSNLIKAYPPEYQPLLIAISNVAVNPKKLEESQHWLNFYEKLIDPVAQLIPVYEKEIAQSKKDEAKYEAQAVELARNRQRELFKAREVILMDKLFEEDESQNAPNTIINVQEEPKETDIVGEADADAILTTLRDL